MMSPLYPCGKPCSTKTPNETVKKLTLFSAIINAIMMESRLQISNPMGMLAVLQSNGKQFFALNPEQRSCCADITTTVGLFHLLSLVCNNTHVFVAVIADVLNPLSAVFTKPKHFLDFIDSLC